MACKAKATKFFEFDQNNSGGCFDIDDKTGIGPRLWIEATDAAHANDIAEAKGLYFNGCDDGRDCACCGDRWHPAYGKGETEPKLDRRYDFNWHEIVFIHRLDGAIERKTVADAPDEQSAA